VANALLEYSLGSTVVRTVDLRWSGTLHHLDSGQKSLEGRRRGGSIVRTVITKKPMPLTAEFALDGGT